VAQKTAHKTVVALYRVAKAIARSWVLSPISARTTKDMDIKKAVMADSFHAKKSESFSMNGIILKLSLIGIYPTARPGARRQHVDPARTATPL
jgi:hypothetical protein